jgi:hypothetical protein
VFQWPFGATTALPSQVLQSNEPERGAEHTVADIALERVKQRWTTDQVGREFLRNMSHKLPN